MIVRVSPLGSDGANRQDESNERPQVSDGVTVGRHPGYRTFAAEAHVSTLRSSRSEQILPCFFGGYRIVPWP